MRYAFIWLCLPALAGCTYARYTPSADGPYTQVGAGYSEAAFSPPPGAGPVMQYQLERDIPADAVRLGVVKIHAPDRADREAALLKACREQHANAVYHLPAASAGNGYAAGRYHSYPQEYLLLQVASLDSAQAQ